MYKFWESQNRLPSRTEEDLKLLLETKTKYIEKLQIDESILSNDFMA